MPSCSFSGLVAASGSLHGELLRFQPGGMKRAGEARTQSRPGWCCWWGEQWGRVQYAWGLCGAPGADVSNALACIFCPPRHCWPRRLHHRLELGCFHTSAARSELLPGTRNRSSSDVTCYEICPNCFTVNTHTVGLIFDKICDFSYLCLLCNNIFVTNIRAEN